MDLILFLFLMSQMFWFYYKTYGKMEKFYKGVFPILPKQNILLV